MREIGLIDVDSHNFPNLALMKISAYHKSIGDRVEWWNGLKHYDRVYMSKVFDETYSDDMEFCINADEVIKGGTGYGLNNKLPDHIEHIMPDYSLYNIKDTAYGFLTRGCPRNCGFCIVSEKEGRRSYKVADLSEWWDGQQNIELLDPNLLACKEREDLLGQLIDSMAWVNFSQGLDVRLITKEVTELINQTKVKNIHFAWDFMKQSGKVIKGLETYAKHANKKHNHVFATVYVLTNYDTTHKEDLYRVEMLKSLGYKAYIMIYNKQTAPKETRNLQRWCNNRVLYESCSFDEYDPSIA